MKNRSERQPSTAVRPKFGFGIIIYSILIISELFRSYFEDETIVIYSLQSSVMFANLASPTRHGQGEPDPTT